MQSSHATSKMRSARRGIKTKHLSFIATLIRLPQSVRSSMTDDPGGHSLLTDARIVFVGFLIAVTTMTLPIGLVFMDAHLTNAEQNVKINNIVNNT